MDIEAKMIRWISGILLILAGMLSLNTSTVAAYILWVLAGVILLPPAALLLIRLFKNPKTAPLFCCAALAFSAGCTAPEAEDNGTGSQNQASENIKTAEPGRETAVKTELSKEDISSWIQAELSGSEPETELTDIKEWEKDNQGTFYKFWRKAVYSQIKGWEDIEDYEKTAEDIAKACNIYKQINGSGNEVDTLLQDAETVSILAEDNKKLKSKYNLDILCERDLCGFQTYYIERQLEMAYSDNLAGKLQEEVESYQPKEYLDWLAYDVDYWMDEPVCGDTCQMVIRTKTDEPFSSAGAYYLAYIDTGETMTLSDSRGFSQKVPICRMLGDGSLVENEFSQYISNIDTCFSLCQKMEQILKTGKPETVDSEDGTGSRNSPAPASDSGDVSQYYIFYDSDKRFLDDWDFDEMDSYALNLARNEIYARHGRLFNNEEIQAYFDSMPWYTGTIQPEDFDDGVFNQYEKANLEKISAIEANTAP